MASRPNIAGALAQAAREINSQSDLDATLDAIVHAAVHSLPGIDHVGISIAYRDGKIETKAGTDQLVWDLDSLQYELNEGPCVHAIRAETVVKVEHIEHDQRWPNYVPRALKYGLKAQMGIQLFVDDKTLGGINLYSTDTPTFDPDLEDAAELYATHAAIALGRVRREQDLNIALQTRKIIGQAIGMVMERYGLDERRAFEYLTRVSQHSNIKLRDIAQEIVEQGNERARSSESAQS